jgi:hypothetical protein
MLQLLAWPLISVRYTVTTSPQARDSVRTVRDLGRMSPQRGSSSLQLPGRDALSKSDRCEEYRCREEPSQRLSDEHGSACSAVADTARKTG